MNMRKQLRFTVALAISQSLLGIAGLAGVATAHTYDTTVPSEPDKTIDGAVTITPGSEGGKEGYYFEYTRFTYRDITATHYHPAEFALQDIEAAYCVAAGSSAGSDSAGAHCHPATSATSQASAYDGAISPHAQGLRIPKDQAEFYSYLRGATNGFNNGQGGNVNQANAEAGTRLRRVTDQKQFDAAVARMYIYQFAATAKGAAANTVDGMAAGAKAFYTMSPAAQMFMQTAAVYKGNLAANASNYDNNALRALLDARGFNRTGRANVGNTDVETLGAVAEALNQGVITLDDIANSAKIVGAAAIGNNANYAKAIDMVESGTFAAYLAEYDRFDFSQQADKNNLNSNTGNAGYANPGAGIARNPQSKQDFYQMFLATKRPSRAQDLADADFVYRWLLDLHDINGVGRIYGQGEAQNFISSTRCFTSLLQDGQRAVGGIPAHDANHMKTFDVNKDGTVDDTELKDGLTKLKTFSEAVALDAKDQAGGIAPGGFNTCAITPTPVPLATPTPPPAPTPTPCGGYGQPPC